MKKHKAYKFRLYPDEKQAKQLANNFGSCRFVFNYFLALTKQTYDEEHKCLYYTDYAKKLISLKEEKTFLKDVDSISLQQSLKHLELAFKNFFKDKSKGYPNYKRKVLHNDTYSTIRVNNNIVIIDNKHIKLPKLGIVKCKIHREIPQCYILKSATLNQTPSGKYYVSVLFEYEEESIDYQIKKNNIIGLDYSNKSLFVCSDDIKVDEKYLKMYRKGEEKLHFLQRTLSRRQKPNYKEEEKGSIRYYKQRIKVAKYHEYLKNKRLDYYNKLSNEIANRYDVVVIEDLNMQDMAKEYKKNGKVVYDNAWGLFCNLLKNKLQERGKELIKVDKYYASSKICSNCKNKNNELEITTRSWICPKCKIKHDRDINASINLKHEGLRILQNN